MESWLHTFSGQRDDPLNPDPKTIEVVDIAHALAMTPRFSGHLREYYSVAQHCVECSNFLEQTAPTLVSIGLRAQVALEGLIHDASEFVICDIPSPIKPAFLVQGRPYKDAEAKILNAVRTKLELPEPAEHILAAVKYADVAMLKVEADTFLHGTSAWDWGPPEIIWELTPLNWREAKAAWLARYEELMRLVK